MKRALFLLFLCFSVPAHAESEAATMPPMVKNDLTIHTATDKIPFIVELAMTLQDQETGLMNRHELPAGQGMLFVMPKDRKVEMWMKDTYIPLDMFFIDSSGEIANIASNVPPLSLDTVIAARPVHAVLELPAGTAEKHGIQPGDRVSHPYFKP